MSATVVAGQNIRTALHSAADRDLLVGDQGARTGREIAERTCRLAGALVARGLTGRRIGLMYRNGFAAYEAFLAVEWIGATRVPVDPDVPPVEASAVFAGAAVDLVLADEEHVAGLTGDVLGYDGVPPSGSSWTDQIEVDSDTTLVLYPRQVVGGALHAVTTSYGNWDAVLRINRELYRTGWYGPGFDDREVLLTMQQLMHGTGMVASFPFLSMGLPQVVLDRFDADRALQAVHEHHVTATFGVPGMLTRMADRAQEDAVLSLRHTLYGGAPLAATELRRVRRVLGPSMVQLYGRFEAGWPLAVLGTSEHEQILAGDDELASSCGRFIPQIEVRLGDAPGKPPGYGELQTRSPMVSPELLDPEGWCSLGDVAYLDDGGYVHLAGRLDGMINTGSYHVYPGQVAEAVESVAGVLRARITGEPDPTWGEAVTAYIVPEDPADWSNLVDRLRSNLPQRLARYKIPKSYHQVAELPAAD
ncbi:class I adenylate-forming enzyme family protein [Leekyejoonella antrihumi]|uniref:Long-chain fatty acid--CoA ligase n=1 Tax=Leekyejoonella antrihumi TaxID=1660198 RepID=A0A563E586_9MICO|nr:fatty acid--CoA ligase family protein [Leekyejoonella antrihumi]TWP37585.1 long-chain fatty acid--CoA ligase [Leekyejoonella antrihumi]